MSEKLAARIQLEITQIDQLFLTYAELFHAASSRSLNLVEVTALASVLHAYYNGLENVFLRIAKDLDNYVPTGSQSHKAILLQMGSEMPVRSAVLSPETILKLAEYLSFRHFYRHSYSFMLDWSKLEPLVASAHYVWLEVKSELTAFVDNL